MRKVCALLFLSLSLCLRVTYEAAPARSVFIKLPVGRGKYKKVSKVGRERGGGVQGSGIDYQFSGHLITMNVPREREFGERGGAATEIRQLIKTH